MTLPSPFPWFGGKSRAASLVWERFGDVANYIEPFFGTGAVLMARPTAPRVETVNDKDAYLCNFWRAMQAEPREVAKWADWPVNEVDLAARRDWVFAQREEMQFRMWRDPDFYDAKLAGWWVWGVSGTIGNAWKPRSTHLGNAGRGVNRPRTHLGNAGRGERLFDYFDALSARLSRVRIMCGDWQRVCTSDVVMRVSGNGIVGVFLDPPYFQGADLYDADCDPNIAADVRAWAIERGHDKHIRIALCCYDGDHAMPDGWSCVAWKARKGYQTTKDDGTHGGHNERIWFSPYCLNNDLFGDQAL